MAQRAADEPIIKVTLNLFQRDVEWLRRHYGYGFSAKIREILRATIRAAREQEQDDDE
jgi:hypothetical protein